MSVEMQRSHKASTLQHQGTQQAQAADATTRRTYQGTIRIEVRAVLDRVCPSFEPQQELHKMACKLRSDGLSFGQSAQRKKLQGAVSGSR
jgi:hypothetical protein